ncbi:MuDR family transposase [Trifolium repens]|nr:MuDR family transposase [Trifolium repens]
MEDYNFVVGQEFRDVKAFRNAIKEAAIAQHFELRIIKRDLVRYFAKCASDGCPWRIRAVKLPNNRFQRLFVSFYASIHGFVNGCFPIVALGGIQLKSKYLSTVLSATSFDADGGLFPLAFAVVDVENDESWTWFMSELHKALEVNIECMPQIIFLSDGQKGIVDAIRRKFPKSSHAFCMRHLSESISKEFKNSRLIHFLWKAAYATTTTTAFKEKMAEIEEASPEAAKWALVYFEGTRYGHLSSNIEVFNKWILDARELPIIHVIERIHGNLITEFDDRRLRSSSWCFVLAPSAERQMAEAINHASTYQVLRSDEVEFEDVYAYTAKCFTVASYRETYAEELHPIPRKLEWRTDESALDNDIAVVRPPKFRRPPGRPEKKRICAEDHNRDKHTVHCSRCNQTGHYKTTCKAEMINSIEQF